MLDRLVGSELQANLGSARIGRKIIVLEQTDSTNDAILKVATADSNEGLVLFSEHQTTGRGQRGNRWESANKSIAKNLLSRSYGNSIGLIANCSVRVKRPYGGIRRL